MIKNPQHPARLKPPRRGKRPPKLLAVIHQSGCTGCEICIQGCPVDCIELVSGPMLNNPSYQQLVEIDLSRCIGCKHCVQDCPWDTIEMYAQDQAEQAWAQETLKTELYLSNQ